MRLLISSLFFKSPFEDLQKHADKVKECTQLFREAAVCHIGKEYERFDLLTDQVARLESQADDIKRNIRNHLPRGILMPVDKFQFFDYLREHWSKSNVREAYSKPRGSFVAAVYSAKV